MTFQDLYGIQFNPFDQTYLRELRPRSAADRAQYAKVEGFGRQIPDVEAWFQLPASIRSAGVYLVYAPQGCGRTSVINYIAQLFAEAIAREGRTAHLFADAVKKRDGAGDIAPVQSILQRVYDYLTSNNVPMDGAFAGLQADYNQYVYGDPGATTVGMLKRIWRQSQTLLQRPPARTPIVALENVQKYVQFEAVQDVFEDVPLVLVSTADDAVSADFQTAFPRRVITLSPLELDDIKQFIAHRWGSAFAGLPAPPESPFPIEGLARVFSIASKRTWEFRGVVNLLTMMFENHLNQEALAAGQPPAEEQRAALRAAQIKATDMLAWALDYSFRVQGTSSGGST